MGRRWRQQRGELSECKNTTRQQLSEGGGGRGKCQRPRPENVLGGWGNTERADGPGLASVQVPLRARSPNNPRSLRICGILLLRV